MDKDTIELLVQKASSPGTIQDIVHAFGMEVLQLSPTARGKILLWNFRDRQPADRVSKAYKLWALLTVKHLNEGGFNQPPSERMLLLSLDEIEGILFAEFQNEKPYYGSSPEKYRRWASLTLLYIEKSGINTTA